MPRKNGHQNKIYSKEEIVRRRTNGESTAAIAKSLGLNPATIRKALLENDIQPESLLKRATEAQRAEMVRRIKSGETVQAVAKAVGFSEAAVKYHWEQSGGVPLEKYKWLTPDQQKEIVQALKDGASTKSLAEQYGVTSTPIHNAWRRSEGTRLTRSRLSQAAEKDVLRRLNLGEGITSIAASLGLEHHSKAIKRLEKGIEGKRQVTVEQRKKILKLFSNGFTRHRIADSLGMDEELIHTIQGQIVEQNGKIALSHDVEKVVLERLNAGDPKALIARELGISIKRVASINVSLLSDYKLTDDKRIEINQASDEGVTAQQIALKLKLPLSVVTHALGMYDGRWLKGRKTPITVRADAVKALENGEKASEVANRLGVTESAVRKWFRSAIESGNAKRNIEPTKRDDFTFAWITRADPELEEWRRLIADWFQSTGGDGADQTVTAVSAFIARYLIPHNLPKKPSDLLARGKMLPDFYTVACPQTYAGQGYAKKISDLVEWVLDTEEFADTSATPPVRLVHQFRNPINKHSGANSGRPMTNESVKTVMPYWIIDNLRRRIVQGPNFSDWKWVQGLMNSSCWYPVDLDKIDLSDPDCVWRRREREGKEPMLEMWSPVRWVAHLIHLQATPRSGQVRALDSGEADTFLWKDGKWIPNKHPLAQGTERRPRQQGAIRRPAPEEQATGLNVLLFFNTNKTADIGKSGTEKGFVCAWPELQNIWENPYFWLEKLRDWQMKYNPIDQLTEWKNIDAKRSLSAKSKAKGHEYPDAAFLFRTPEAHGVGPVASGILEHAWIRLLAEQQECLKREGHVNPDGSEIELINPETGRTWSTPHATRVSLITHMILDGDVPPEIMMKIVGHARFIMTIYYTKPGLKRIQDSIAEATIKLNATKDQTLMRDLKGLKAEQMRERVVFNVEDWTTVLPTNPADRSPLGWLFMHDGICLAGGNSDNQMLPGCHNGGPPLRRQGNDPKKWVFSPVPGGVRNCSRCRWKCAGKHHAVALGATFNNRQYHLHKASESAIASKRECNHLTQEKARAENATLPFSQGTELRAAERKHETAMQKMQEYTLDLVAINRMIERIGSLPDNTDGRTALAAQGDLLTLNTIIEETDSELLVLAGIAADVEFFPDLDPGVAVFEFAQLLDQAFEREGQPLVLARLSEKEKLAASNAIMRELERAANPDNSILGRRKVVEIIDRGESLEKLLGVKLKSVLQLANQNVQVFQKPVTLCLVKKEGTHDE